jgi:hypothetical protein
VEHLDPKRRPPSDLKIFSIFILVSVVTMALLVGLIELLEKL